MLNSSYQPTYLAYLPLLYIHQLLFHEHFNFYIYQFASPSYIKRMKNIFNDNVILVVILKPDYHFILAVAHSLFPNTACVTCSLNSNNFGLTEREIYVGLWGKVKTRHLCRYHLWLGSSTSSRRRMFRKSQSSNWSREIKRETFIHQSSKLLLIIYYHLY